MNLGLLLSQSLHRLYEIVHLNWDTSTFRDNHNRRRRLLSLEQANNSLIKEHGRSVFFDFLLNYKMRREQIVFMIEVPPIRTPLTWSELSRENTGEELF